VLYPLPTAEQRGTLWETARKADGSNLYFQGQASR
jgi:hypothetical protein